MRPLLLPALLIAVIFCGCQGTDQLREPQFHEQFFPDSLPGQSPFLTKDCNGNTILSWVRMINDSSAVFCYAVSKDGKLFDKPVEIPGSQDIQPHGENLPKIIFKPSGEVIALWGTKSNSKINKHAGKVSYAQSFDGGKTWCPQVRPLVADSSANDQRYYDVALLPDGEVAIIWLDSRKTNHRQGSALFFASTVGKEGFGEGRRIAQSCCQCCRTDLFVDSKGGIHTLYRGLINDSIRDMVHAVSKDGGKTFSSPVRISNDDWVLNSCPHTGPSMSENRNGLQFAWFTGGKNKGSYYTSSPDNGTSFTPRQQVSELGSHPQLAGFVDGKLATVWDEMGSNVDRSFKRIGIELRDPHGRLQRKAFLTADTGFASYPVIVPVSHHEAIVAYCMKKPKGNYIAYQLVSTK